ncbi:MAG: GEVED domain-containing protein [Clostridium sp.]|nr:GEVED domain-containing protein [Clostridium sp.]
MKRLFTVFLSMLFLGWGMSVGHAQTADGSGEETAAVWLIVQTGDNLLLKANGTDYYLNAYFGDGGMVLHNGSGDASQWKIVTKDGAQEVTAPEEGVEYYLRSQMASKLNQYLTYMESSAAKPLQLQETADEASVFTFKVSGSGYKLYNVSAGGYVQSADYHVCLTVGGMADLPGDDEDPVVLTGDCYQINRNGNASMYLMHADDGSLKYAAADNAVRCFWQFVPSGKDGCYYVKNATTGQYLQSSRTPGRNGRVTMGADPVEYKVGMDRGATSATRGYYYLCSTDQTIDAGKTGTLGLNAQPGTGNVVCYDIQASASANSYWALTEVDYAYEVPLFAAAADLDHAGDALRYRLTATDGRCLAWSTTEGLTLEAKANADCQGWFFVGTTNEREGYYILNQSCPGLTLNRDADGRLSLGKVDEPTRWYAETSEVDGIVYLSFVPYADRESEGGRLTAGGEIRFLPGNFRSAYSLSAQIYYLPCGSQTSVYLTEASVAGTDVQKQLNYRATARPSSYYTLFTEDKAAVSRGRDFTLTLNTNEAPAGMQVLAYFDWNADGEFESMVELTSSPTAIVTVPDEAPEGQSRMRVRLTDNGLTDAEDDATGEIYDFILCVAAPVDGRVVTVAPNAAERGVAYIVSGDEKVTEQTVAYGTELTARAEPLGNAVFRGWQDGKTIVSTSAEYTFNVTEHTSLRALFSPNTQVLTGVRAVETAVSSRLFHLVQDGRQLHVTVLAGALTGIDVYAADGTRVCSGTKATLSLENLSRGTYIVSVRTEAGTGSARVVLP